MIYQDYIYEKDYIYDLQTQKEDDIIYIDLIFILKNPNKFNILTKNKII